MTTLNQAGLFRACAPLSTPKCKQESLLGENPHVSEHYIRRRRVDFSSLAARKQPEVAVEEPGCQRWSRGRGDGFRPVGFPLRIVDAGQVRLAVRCSLHPAGGERSDRAVCVRQGCKVSYGESKTKLYRFLVSAKSQVNKEPVLPIPVAIL